MQDVRFYGWLDAGGVRWFKAMEILRAGKRYFDLEIDSVRAKPAITDSRLVGPVTQPTREK